MTVIPYNMSELPPLAQQYANGEDVVCPTYPEYSRVIIHRAKALRRIVMRKFGNEHPGAQWYRFSDYRELMGGEIAKFGNEVLAKKVRVTDDTFWTKLCADCPRVTFLYEHYGRGVNLSNRQALISLRFRVWGYALSDPRTLGEIEEHCLGTVRFGIPTGSNRPPLD